MLGELSAWMAERVFEVQQTHFKACMMTIKHITSSRSSSLKGPKLQLAPVLSGPVMKMNDLKELLANLKGASLGGQVKIRPTNEVKMKFSMAVDPAGSEVIFIGADHHAELEMQSPGADYLAINNPVVEKLDTNTPGAGN